MICSAFKILLNKTALISGLLILNFVIPSGSYSQETDSIYFTGIEDKLKACFTEVFNTIDDYRKKMINKKILDVFGEILEDEMSFEYPFDSVPYIGIMKSYDDLVKIYNWNLVFNDGTYRYFGFIQYHDKKYNEILLYPLTDKSDSIKDPEYQSLDNAKWYGALYYEILCTNYKGRTYYTLLGWDGNDDFSNKKIIDILYFDKNLEPHFGADIFKTGKKKKKNKRIIFEYNEKAGMLIKFDEKYQMIVMDRLVPIKPKYENDHKYYGPDGGLYDGLYFDNGKWVLIKDINAKNPEEKEITRKPINYTFPAYRPD